MKTIWILLAGALLCTLVALSHGEAEETPANAAGAQERAQPAAEDVVIVHAEIPELPLEALAAIASEIAHVRVVESRPFALASGLAQTRYELSGEAVWKGWLPESFTLEVVGSEETAPIVRCPQAPRFEPGDELVLFLCLGSEPDSRGVLGLGHGAYRVERDADGASRIRGRHARGGEPLQRFQERVESALLALESEKK